MLASTSGLRALGLGCLALGVVLAVWFGYQRSSLERPSAFQLLDWIDKAEFIANQLKIAATSCSVRLDLTSAGLDANTQETLAQGVLSARIALSPPIEDGPCVWTTIRVECAGRTCVPERVWSGKPCWVADRPLRNLDVSLRVVTDSVAESKGAGNHPDGVPCVSGIRAAAGEADISLEVLLSPGGGCASEAVPAARSLSAAAATACGAATAFWGSLPPVPRPGRHTAAALHTSTVQRHVEVVATLVLPKTETAQPGFNRSPQRAQQCSAHLRALAALDLQRELEAAIDPFAGAFPGVHLQARVKSLDFLPAPLTASSIYSALEDVGAFSSAGIFVGSPEATKAVHFALVVLPCSAEGVPASVTVGESAAPSFASRQGDVVHITHAAEAADALRGSFAALIADAARRHVGLASWEPSPKGCDEWCELMRQTVAESARPVIRSVGIERARGMGVVAAYRLGSLLGNSRHLEMPEPLQTRVSEALSVLMDHDASRVRVTAAAEELSALAADSSIRYHSQWGFSAILQLYVLGLWPLLVSAVRPFLVAVFP